MPLPELWVPVRDFLQQGGDVLYLIGVTAFLMWILILERLWFFKLSYSRIAATLAGEWSERADQQSWYAQQIRRELVSRATLQLRQSIPMIKTLVSICPLLGLLGTVTGMIEVFEVMALTGSSNARAMASGVSKATIPTMAGMVAALAGLGVSVWLERTAEREAERTEDRLTVTHRTPGPDTPPAAAPGS